MLAEIVKREQRLIRKGKLTEGEHLARMQIRLLMLQAYVKLLEKEHKRRGEFIVDMKQRFPAIFE